MRGEFLDLSGARLYYYAAGSRGAGDPVVLVHGFPTSSHLWNEVVPLLPVGHRIVVVDLLGYGRSDPPRDLDVSLAGHAHRLVGMFDMLGIRRACVVGHGIGGGIAQWLAVNETARVSHLCLVDSVAFDVWPRIEVRLARAMAPLLRHMPPGAILAALRSRLLAGYMDADRARRSFDFYLRPFSTVEGRNALIRQLSTLNHRETRELASRLGAIRLATAIVVGARDPFLPRSVGARLHAAIARSTLHVASDARHFTPEEAPTVVAAAVTELLRR